jgi:hypothetical protein
MQVMHITPVSRFWLGRKHLDLSFLQPIAKAIGFSPARRPAAPDLRHNSLDRDNMRIVRFVINKKAFAKAVFVALSGKLCLMVV